MKGNVDNLVTLCIDQIDADRLALRRKIEESLAAAGEGNADQPQRRQLLLPDQRRTGHQPGDQECRSHQRRGSQAPGRDHLRRRAEGAAEASLPANKMDFDFNRRCDSYPDRQPGGRGLCSSRSSRRWPTTTSCTGRRSASWKVRTKRADLDPPGRQREPWAGNCGRCSRPTSTSAPRTTAPCRPPSGFSGNWPKITGARRGAALRSLLSDDAGRRPATSWRAKPLEIKANCSDGCAAMMPPGVPHHEHVHEDGLPRRLKDPPNPQKEIQAILRGNDIAQQTLAMDHPESNPRPSRISATTSNSAQDQPPDRPVRHDRGPYANRPYGWPAMEVAILVARLIVAGEISS